MELARLEKYKTQFRLFKSAIDSMQSYLQKVNRQAKDAVIITPHNLSAVLNIPETDAFFLLSLAEKENILHKKYKVFATAGNDFLGDFDDTHSIPEEITDPEGNSFDRDHYYVDITYELEK
ncbi:hypothetical protein [Mucilaginibacter sp. dw_454]|uniref:hypothetical protein n=1 Tax=Mucilaginibacter sp. dw_454 TaxID=2720079 RepID=UPI001BD526F8|nr:hypothetical protein [Mucilaginibacter sp. dw_454]